MPNPTVVEWGIILYVANCFVHALPVPTGSNEWYLFAYRFVHLILFNIKNVLATSGAARIVAATQISESSTEVTSQITSTKT